MIRVYRSFHELPAGYEELFKAAGRRSYFLSRSWFETLAAAALGPKESLRIYGQAADSPDAAPGGLLVMKESGEEPAFGRARVLSSLSNFYSMEFAPLLPTNGAAARQGLNELVEAIAGEPPGWDVFRIAPLGKDSADFAATCDAFKSAGMFVEPYFAFGNRYETVEEDCFQSYFDRRPSRLRNTYIRKRRTLDRSGRGRIVLPFDGPEIEDAIAGYEQIYAASWKSPERYPEFMPKLMRNCAKAGCLRLGIIFVDGQPAAAQFWIVSGGRATIYKLAYHEAFKSMSLGTILGMELARHVIETDRVREIDYGSGDDPYKADWLSSRRELWGLVAYNPRTRRGVYNMAKVRSARAFRRIFEREPA